MEERRVFDALRVKMSARRMTYYQVFWFTGISAFFLSSVLDNLTTALVLGAVVLAIGKGNKAFVAMACINVVVAANAGGAFCPFGDITTLMVWQKGKLEFFEFFHLFFPSVINWLVPAVIMSFAIPKGAPEAEQDTQRMKPGAKGVMILFALTIITAVAFRNFLDLPPALGMMLGLGYLQVWSYFLQQTSKRKSNADMMLNSFKEISRVEWDTMLFFFGIIFAVGGLGVMGHLALASQWLYAGQGPTIANIAIGALSAIVDNIPLMFAVLTMNPEMDHAQWLLITLTAGVGGSLLSIGSAAGVALMGLARGQYTFGSHLKWTWAIALGYAASIGLHLVLNGV
jgi:Na+/H+ antiporter NhaD/arsenite permease-like protein